MSMPLTVKSPILDRPCVSRKSRQFASAPVSIGEVVFDAVFIDAEACVGVDTGVGTGVGVIQLSKC